ncbi:hypothetical protein MT340_003070 [Staphylococcus sp. NRL 16/872]|nr:MULTISPECIES: hypothetical protein [unclassified Staphylococcus]WEN69950.1 hypothetical protein MT340_003070 [Staphylococcus sp. NRL 16/872]
MKITYISIFIYDLGRYMIDGSSNLTHVVKPFLVKYHDLKN